MIRSRARPVPAASSRQFAASGRSPRHPQDPQAGEAELFEWRSSCAPCSAKIAGAGELPVPLFCA